VYSIRKTLRFEDVIILNNLIFPCDPLEVDERSRAWIVKNSKGEPSGFCTMRMLDDKIAFMDRGGILDEHRGKGIHKKLIKVRERYARSQGYKTVITYVMADNYASLFTLVRQDYKMYTPDYAYAGVKGVVYFNERTIRILVCQ
jgi:predicted GNAT family acetyltransferase